jgi:myo-inositol catabolism protein IolC
MTLGFDGRLFLLAFDHRGSFTESFFGVEGEPTAEQAAAIADAKAVIYEGVRRALEDGASRESAGVLVDEQFGSDVARAAKAEGLHLAMPVERSGQTEFDFEYGEEFGEHIERFDPSFSKVLVRYNPEGDAEMNARQIERLRRLGAWLHERGRTYLFELLVPAEPHQLATVDGDAARYDQEVRPGLVVRAIGELQQAGVEPDIWKLEGLDRREDCAAVAEAARTGGRDRVVCVVLGRGADQAAVEGWLRAASGVPGYAGFAIGRSIWWDPLRAFVDGEAGRDDVAARIGSHYRRFIDAYGGG